MDRIRKYVDDFFGKPMNLELTEDGKRLKITPEMLAQGLPAHQ